MKKILTLSLMFCALSLCMVLSASAMEKFKV